MKRDVFISHASADVDAAELLVESLEQRGLRCWIATRDIGVGEDYAEAIIEGIRSSRALITLLSSAALTSRNVTREVERAHALDIALLTVRLEDVEPSGSLEYFLASRQFIDGFPSLQAKTHEVSAAVHKALGRPPAEQSPPGAPSNLTTEDRRWMPALVGGASVLLVAVLAFIFLGGPDDSPTATGATPTSAEPTTSESPTTTEAAPNASLPQVIGPTSVGAYEQNWFWVEAPDNATVTYIFDGNQYEGREFWMRPDVEGPGSFTVAVTDEALNFRQEVDYDTNDRRESELACYLITTDEMQNLLGAGLLTRTLPERGENTCDWDFIAGAANGVVDVSRHRPGSSDARLKWFLTSMGGEPMEASDLDAEVYSAVGDGYIRFMADSQHGLAEVGVPTTLDKAELRGLDVLRLLSERIAPGVATPAVGCELLTTRDLDLLLGVKMTREPVVDPQSCFYSSDLQTGLVVSVARTDGVDPDATLDMIEDNELAVALEFSELDGLGDRAILGKSSIIAIVTAVQGDTSISVSVGKTVSSHDVSTIAVQLATAVLSLI